MPGDSGPGGRYRRFERVRAPRDPEPEGSGGRIGALVGRVVRPPRTPLGFLAVIAVVGGLGSLAAIAGVASEKWTETEGFCSQCHTMAPQAKAYKLSVHRDVACGECHVGPGIKGFVKAKINGAKQTLEVLTGTFPEPIEPPDHELLPDPKDTCMECHSLDKIAATGNPMDLVLRSRYREDKANTREMVAVVVRPSRLGEGKGGRGAHWHVQQKVEFASPDEQSRKIDWVGVTYKDGSTKQFISRREITVSSDARPDIRRLMSTEKTRDMSCIECHNRVGHEFPAPDRAIDDAIAEGEISRSLPYIKRMGVSRVDREYESVEEAERGIEGIRGMYAAKYPLIARKQRRKVEQAVDELKLIYRLVASPEMKAISSDYPSNLGHQSSPGCFRCHDGGHYQVTRKGRVLDKVIPWACTTCHTFPQVGGRVSSVSLLGRPPSHRSKLWVFKHKGKAASLDPGATNSGYCSNCHDSGAAEVKHDEMLFRHPQAIAKAGLKACSYCHQEASCARCHKKPMLEKDKDYVHRDEDLRRRE